MEGDVRTEIVRAMIVVLVCSCSAGSSGGGAAGGAKTGYSGAAAFSSPFSKPSTQAFGANGRNYGQSYAERKAQLDAILSATTVAGCGFSLTLPNMGPPDCYGPNINLGGTHPDGSGQSSLPGGDTGLWNSTDGTGGDACSAAELNGLIEQYASYAQLTNLVGASLNCYVRNSDLGLPAAGSTTTLDSSHLTAWGFTKGTTTLSATAATVTASSANGNSIYTYNVTGTFTLATMAGTEAYPVHTVVQYLSDGTIEKVVTAYEIYNASAQAFNCRDMNIGPAPDGMMGMGPPPDGMMGPPHPPDGMMGPPPDGFLGPPPDGMGPPMPHAAETGVLLAGRITYNIASDRMTLELDHAEYCGSSGALDSSYAVSRSTGGTHGWAGNFNHGQFSFDPMTLDGNYAYAWQAGAMDGASRVFNVSIATDHAVQTGTSYFGFGKSVDDTTAPIGTIQGMVCNWAGPGGAIQHQDHLSTAKPYVQSQTMTRGDAGQWTVASEKITYAVVNSCNYSSSFAAFNYSSQMGGMTNDRPASSTSTSNFNLLPIATLRSSGFTVPSEASFP